MPTGEICGLAALRWYQTVNADVWWTVDAHWQFRGTGSPVGVTLHPTISPMPGKLVSRATGVTDDRHPAWKAYLATMSMTAEVKGDTKLRRLL